MAEELDDKLIARLKAGAQARQAREQKEELQAAVTAAEEAQKAVDRAIAEAELAERDAEEATTRASHAKAAAGELAATAKEPNESPEELASKVGAAREAQANANALAKEVIDRWKTAATKAEAVPSAIEAAAASKKLAAHLDAPNFAASMSSHTFWWWRVLAGARFLHFFVPWPLDLLLTWIFGRWERTRRWSLRGSAFVTVAIPLYLYCLHSLNQNAQRETTLMVESGKVMFSAAFLLGTILSLSIAIPGQAIVKAILKTDPRAAIDFVIPFMWALMWGLAGAGLLFLSPIYESRYRPFTMAVGIYGAMMELNALVHTIRMYLFGLVIYAEDN